MESLITQVTRNDVQQQQSAATTTTTASSASSTGLNNQSKSPISNLSSPSASETFGFDKLSIRSGSATYSDDLVLQNKPTVSPPSYGEFTQYIGNSNNSNLINNNNNNNNNNSSNGSSRRSSHHTITSNGATVVLRKPRAARRFFKTLLCCWGLAPRSRRSGGGGNIKNASINGIPVATTDGCDPPNPPYTVQMPEKLLLPPVRPCDAQKICLIIDLDETLVHSSFKPVKNPDFIIPVEIDGVIHQVYVLKRPFVDEFLQRIGNIYECVLFTASLAKYADPVADLLDRWGVFKARLFREACVFHKGNYVKDLNRLGRDLKRLVIVDNSPASYAFHPDNAIPVQSWFDDMNDAELLDLLPFLEKLARVDNVYMLLRNSNEPQCLPPEPER